MERKLTAILSADVEGYSRLMGVDEEATIRTLTSYQKVMAFLIELHRGRVVDSPGDNLLAEFGSVVDAVQCAVVIQSTLRTENANLPQERRMEFRIGINLGDVMVEGARIYGDGVNIAARVEGLAEGGGICISGTVFDQIKGKVSVNFEDLGPQQVKNIAQPIRAYRAVLGSGTESARPQQKIEVPRQDHRETSNRYDRLTSRLGPLLYSGLEDVLRRHAGTLKPSGELNLSTSVLTGDLLKFVGSTFPPGHLGRQHERKLGEGVQGYFAEAKTAGFAQTTRNSKSANRSVFDRFGKQIGEIPVSRNAATAGRWIYVRPIFERSTTNPWSSRVVGTLVVHSSGDEADSLFRTEEFHDMVDSIATEVSPYLDAIQVLMGEEKL